MKIDIAQFFVWGVQGIIAGAAIYIVNILSSMKNSIETLNERVAVIIEKTQWHEKELERHGDRISQLENKE